MTTNSSQNQQPQKAFKVKGRRASRQLAMQSLYRWQVSGESLVQLKRDLEKQTYNPNAQEEENLSQIFAVSDKEFCFEIIEAVIEKAEIFDEIIKKYADLEFEKLGVIELSILRIGLYELQNCLETPTKVIINEAVELAKQFGAQDSFKFVNGLLDKAKTDLNR